MHTLPTSQDVLTLKPQCLALVMPIVFAVLCLFDTSMSVVQFVANETLLVHPLIVMQLQFSPGIGGSVLELSLDDGGQLLMNDVLGVVCEFSEIDAVRSLA